VTVVYGPPAQPAYTYNASPAQTPQMGIYDQYGQRVSPHQEGAGGGYAPAASGSPIYLIAFKDHVIRAAISYSVNGNTLHYVTPEHEDKQTSLENVDRGFSIQLNRERHVAFQLPNQ
jgi:hypothetical protein